MVGSRASLKASFAQSVSPYCFNFVIFCIETCEQFHSTFLKLIPDPSLIIWPMVEQAKFLKLIPDTSLIIWPMIE